MHLSSRGIEASSVLGVSVSSLAMCVIVYAVQIYLEGHAVEEVDDLRVEGLARTYIYTHTERHNLFHWVLLY